MSKELKEKYISAYCERERNPESWAKYLRNSIFDVLKIGGLLVSFEKPALETEFCFGYGYSGVSTLEEAKEAAEAARAVKDDFNLFVEKNTEGYDRKIQELKDGAIANWLYMLVPSGRFKGCGNLISCRNFIHHVENFRSCNPGARELTSEEVFQVIKVIEAQRANIVKRCHTYWKRYGGTKLHTWSYLVD